MKQTVDFTIDLGEEQLTITFDNTHDIDEMINVLIDCREDLTKRIDIERARLKAKKQKKKAAQKKNNKDSELEKLREELNSEMTSLDAMYQSLIKEQKDYVKPLIDTLKVYQKSINQM